jgi:hypothetical protein
VESFWLVIGVVWLVWGLSEVLIEAGTLSLPGGSFPILLVAWDRPGDVRPSCTGDERLRSPRPGLAAQGAAAPDWRMSTCRST